MAKRGPLGGVASGIGKTFGGIGRGIGKAAGGIGSALGGTSPQQLQFQQFTPQQQDVLSQILQMGMQGLQKQPGDFGPIREAATQRFQEQTVPTLAERFTAMGEGAQRGSGFQQALGQAGSGLERELAAMEQQFGQQQGQQLLQLLGLGLTPQYQSALMPGKTGVAQELLQSAPYLYGLFRRGGPFGGVQNA